MSGLGLSNECSAIDENENAVEMPICSINENGLPTYQIVEVLDPSMPQIFESDSDVAMVDTNQIADTFIAERDVFGFSCSDDEAFDTQNRHLSGSLP